ncbi:putative SWI/SNF-related matrix-associated actin-dependent regulator of chromatin subfamily A member 3-like 1 isoform X2 [Diospyros lotus]|uniref:putative SWI/SNF-related matrix-associated actin-dependent regulator of chromatin subfamily A member 3-like 1 isoform X2 n=2 Tax=Diospyros lotus TaxID=55363 RepID=UPI00225525D3|nr:putative SWI/SNF-related matrix-associated actin-dependent regulator of chromatin subfamily A member 3-like 1 isoform X2 [Diospyros lotus]
MGSDVESDPVGFFMSLERWPGDMDCDDGGGGGGGDDMGPASQSSETYLLGFVIVNIVGLQYYTGTISGREMVCLVREPLNPYDPNAIKVLNTRTVQVGHVERYAAMVLAPLMDQNLITVEGIVPNTPARGSRYRIPVQIHIFAFRESFSRVKSAISRGGLQLISSNDASFTLSQAVVVKERKASQDGRSVDEIFKLVDENVSNKSAMEALEPPKEVIKSELFLHQKEGLGWMVHRENSCELPPFWEEKDGAYVNVLTNYQTRTRPEPLRGGIFADDMGLGKTLTLLSLIAIDKCGCASPFSVNSSREIAEQSEGTDGKDDKLVVLGSKKLKRGRVSKNDSSSRKTKKTEATHFDKIAKGKSVGGLDSCADASTLKPTLIVCPPSVFSTWVTQLEEHTRPGKFKVYMYYGERTKDVQELQKYDIVLTTYSTLACEEPGDGLPMKKIKWWRVILDEAHVIKNANSQQSRAVTSLNAERRWVVTGTPIQNGSLDLFSLMAFLRFEPFSIKSYWNSLVQRPLSHGNEKGLSRLQVLMATISLRRTKDKALIGLPPKTMETCFVELSAEERELYDLMENEAKGVVRNYIHAGSVTSNYSTVLGIILRLRQICTDMALCPSDLKSFLPSNNIGDVSNNPELLRKMVSLLQDGEDLDCPICICPPNDVVITCCAHIFCRSCILKTLKRTKPCCPLCRRPLSETDLFSSLPDSSDTDNSKVTRSSTSSKVFSLLKLLSASRDQNPTTKSVVFSQFRKMLILLEEPLKAAGFKVLRLDGTMNAKRRAHIIQEFELPAPDGPTVLLASLKASCAGINLTAASRVYLLEPWWNPAVEEQAMDRVYRIGQKEDVKIVRMIARNSIEERILELQEKKKKLAREAFGRRGLKDRRDINIDDLQTLMSLDN